MIIYNNDLAGYILCVLIYCNMAKRGLTDIYARFLRVPEGECGYISKTLSTAVLQQLCNIFKSIVAVVLVTIEMLLLRYYTATLDTVLEATMLKTQAIHNTSLFA